MTHHPSPLTLKVVITAETPLHIGAAGRVHTQAQRGLLKDAEGWPYIPASAFKGRLRHQVESLARSAGLEVCDPHYPRCSAPSSACLTCRLFGSPWVPGQLIFQDLHLTGPEALMQRRTQDRLRWPQTVFRHGVALSRPRRAAMPGLLYTTELFLPGVPLIFEGAIEAIPTLEAATWLLLGLRTLESLGSDRSRGLGWVRIAFHLTDAAGHAVPLETLPRPWEGTR